MKKLAILLSVIVFSLTAQAKVWRVNNIAAMNANFTSFVAAQSTASANDTLYFEGSTISYGNIVLTKPLVIISLGFFLEENPQTQSNFITAKFGNIELNTGSSGSLLTGLVIQEKITINVSDIAITKCYIGGISFNNATVSGDILLLQNYIKGGLSDYYSRNTIFNLIISNNYISSTISLGATTSGSIFNNIIDGYLLVSNFTINNNILTSGTLTQNNNVFYNNICNGNQFPLGNGNQQNVIMSDVFVGATGNSSDGQWQLKEYSPALGAGNDGKDCGMFGGESPYVLSGLPSIPAIYEVTMPATGTSNNGINVTIKAKTH